jgi:hypothetical protein
MLSPAPTGCTIPGFAPVRPWWVWFDALGMEPVAVPACEATPALLAQLDKEGVRVRCVLARSTLVALRLAFPPPEKPSPTFPCRKFH